MSIPFILSIIAALCILPTLVAGAISDVRSRTFPKAYWKYTAPTAGIVVFMQYLVMVSDRDYSTVGILLAISVALSLAFYFIGLRFGSGGDWRALIYISIISPALILTFWFFMMVVAFVQSIYETLKPEDGKPVLFRTIPFAVAICVGYAVAVGFTVFQNL